MSYTGFVCQIKNLRDHPNADRLYLGECFGNTVCVSKTGYTDGMTGAYFPTDGQLSVEFAEKNNLVRKKDENGNNVGGYMDPDKRNITAIKLRGEKSDGLFLPLSCLDYCFEDGAAANLKLGDTISVVNGHPICEKYIPRSNHRRGGYSEGNRTRKKKINIAPLFMEHVDTEQLAYNLGAFKSGDEIEISLKCHGTSQRTGHLPVLKGYKRTLWDRLLRREGTPIYEYDLVTGTRRTVIENTEGGYYGNNEFRMPHAEFFRNKLWKNETVYYEVVGFTDTGVPIMSPASNSKMNDKEFVKQYGETTVFSYGCSPTGKTTLYGRDDEGEFAIESTLPQSDIYVYRMTMTSPDGEVVEYTPDFMRYRCEQMGVKCVPLLWKGVIPENPASADDPTITAGEWIKNVAERFYDGPDPIGKTHVREGVVVRVVNRPKFCAYKHKNFSFKVLEGLVKAVAEAPDIEEAQEILDEQ